MVQALWRQGSRLLTDSFQEVATAMLSKGVVALTLVAIYDMCGRHYLGDAGVLYIWVAFFLVDFVAGLMRATLLGSVTLSRALKGVRKFFIHFLSVAIVNFLCYSFRITSGLDTFLIVNLYIFILTLTEAISIVVNLERMGMNVPAPLAWLLYRWRHKLIRSLGAQVCGGEEVDRMDPEFMEMVNKYMVGRRKGEVPDTGQRRRASDAVDFGNRSGGRAESDHTGGGLRRPAGGDSRLGPGERPVPDEVESYDRDGGAGGYDPGDHEEKGHRTGDRDRRNPGRQ